MSESPFPFGASSDASARVEDEPSPDRRRNAIALGALAAVVLGAGAYFFLGGGAVEDEQTFLQPAAAAAAPAARPAAPKAVGKLPVASKVRLGRSPFEVLYTPPKPAAAAALAPAASLTNPVLAAPAAAAGAGSVPGVVAAPVPAPVQAAPSSPTAPVPPSSADKPAPQLHALELTRVYGEDKDRTAVFVIDGKQQTAKVGSVFGPSAELLLLSLQQGPTEQQWTAVLQVGDGDPFDVLSGTTTHVP